MIIQLSHLPYLREHTQRGLDQVCHLLNALAMMTVKMNEQIGTLKCSLISWGQMFLACIWTVSRHMGSSKNNGSTSGSASLPQLYPAPSSEWPVWLTCTRSHCIRGLAFFFPPSFYFLLSGNEGLIHQSSLGALLKLSCRIWASYRVVPPTQSRTAWSCCLGVLASCREREGFFFSPSFYFYLFYFLLILNCASLIMFAAWRKCNSREQPNKMNKNWKKKRERKKSIYISKAYGYAELLSIWIFKKNKFWNP